MTELTTLYFDCFSGASGDMMLGALLDRGSSARRLRARPRQPGDRVRLRSRPSACCGPACRRRSSACSEAEPAATRQAVDRHAPAQSHVTPRSAIITACHDHRTHRRSRTHHRRTIRSTATSTACTSQPAGDRRLIERSALSRQGRTGRCACSTGWRGRSRDPRHAGRAGPPARSRRARLHHRHRRRRCFGLEWFGADRIVASPLNVGSGTVKCAHGMFPGAGAGDGPAAAGVPVYAGRGRRPSW